ncbi:MAG: hypothetical protein O3A53_17135 [Acidobacteria bacterium]|nr:hypothetical protein [Acidobacteriota bacterium]MDA1236511.1 hypothetical protein [Acidobacteriota bacterium]
MGRFLSLATALLGCLAALAGYDAVSTLFERPAHAAIDAERISAAQRELALSRFGETGTFEAPAARYVGREETAPLTAADYLALLKTLGAPRHGGPREAVSTTEAGPGRLALSRFFPAKGSGEAQFWIEATVPGIPNLALLPKGSVEIEIERVQQADGADVYARESRFETDFFETLALEEDPAADVYSGVRAVRVAGSVHGDDIAYVTGRLALRLPIEAEAIAFGKNDVGVERVSASEASVELIAVGGGEAAFRTTGRPEAYVAIYAYDREGRRLAPAGESVRANGLSADRKALFHGEVDRVEVIFTRGYMRKTYPFVLKGAGAPRPFPFGPQRKASTEPVIV